MGDVHRKMVSVWAHNAYVVEHNGGGWYRIKNTATGDWVEQGGTVVTKKGAAGKAELEKLAAGWNGRVVEIDPRLANLKPVHDVGHNAASLARAEKTVPFNQALADAQQGIQLVEYNGNFYVLSGHHRMYGLRNLHTSQNPAPATVKVKVYTPEEYCLTPDADPIFRNNLVALQQILANAEKNGPLFPIK